MELNPYCIKNILIVLEKSMEPDQFGVVRPIVPEELLGKLRWIVIRIMFLCITSNRCLTVIYWFGGKHI